MSARRERPPSGKVHRSSSGANLANVQRDSPRPSTALPRASTGPIKTFEAFELPGKGRPQSGSGRGKTANPILFNKSRPSTSQGMRDKTSNQGGFSATSSGHFNFETTDFNNNKNNNQTDNDFGTTNQFSHRSETSELSTNEILRRMREKSDSAKNKVDFATIEALGGYNVYSRPHCSQSLPLRTVLLDPEVNNFPRSRTRTELMKKIKMSGIPHSSYDLDMDGYVSQQDYKLAKRFDFDGNGVLDPDERHIGKQILADEFFKRHAHDLSSFGPNLADNDHRTNVQKLVNSYSFERAYDKLIQHERKLRAESSKPIIACMQSNIGEDILKHNYYTNKFDSTAWNDLDGIPRSASNTFLSHNGSRKKLLFTRQEGTRAELQYRMDNTKFKTFLPVMNCRRVNMITDTNFENS